MAAELVFRLYKPESEALRRFVAPRPGIDDLEKRIGEEIAEAISQADSMVSQKHTQTRKRPSQAFEVKDKSICAFRYGRNM